MPGLNLKEQAGEPPFAGRRVLVADPDPANLDLLRRALESKGCLVGTTTSAVKALDMIREDEYHLIIAEATMPDLDGFTMFETVRYDPRTGRIPFVFLTADKAPESRQRAVELGADGYLVKPVPARELFEITSGLLERLEAAHEGGGISDLSGRIGTFGVEEIVQILQAGGKTGHLVVHSTKATADIFFVKGDVFNANFAGIEGDEAIYLIFAVKEGSFSFRSGLRTQVRNVTANVASLLLEGMRRMDEAREALQGRQTGRFSNVVEVGASLPGAAPLPMKPLEPAGSPGPRQAPAAAPRGRALVPAARAAQAPPARPAQAAPPAARRTPGPTKSPSPEQVPAVGGGGDFSVSFDEGEPLKGEVELPEAEPLPTGRGMRLAGSPPPTPKSPGPKAARRPPTGAEPTGRPKRRQGGDPGR